LEAVIFGMMLSWTPSLLVFAYLLWRAPLIESDEASSDSVLATANHILRTEPSHR
jgi:hypothetical protein